MKEKQNKTNQRQRDGRRHGRCKGRVKNNNVPSRTVLASAYRQLRADFDELLQSNAAMREELRRERNLVAILMQERAVVK